MILIISEVDDVHALSVQSCLARQLNRESIILDAADYPTKWTIDLHVGNRSEYTIKTATAILHSAEVQGTWRRRVKPHVIHEAVSDREVRRHCYREADSLFRAFLGSMVNVVNPEECELLASKKAYQLQAALEAGLRTPDTLVSSDPDEIKQFYAEHDGKVVFKVLTPPAFQLTETRLLKQEYLEVINSAVFAPTIYQELIVPKHHLRVTVVDDKMFCASLETTKEHALLDWRLEPDPIIRAVDAPPGVGERLMRLMRRIGVRYGAIDLIVNGDGECFFLEVNPGGQFLFVEIQTGQPISLAVAEALSSPPQSEPTTSLV